MNRVHELESKITSLLDEPLVSLDVAAPLEQNVKHDIDQGSLSLGPEIAEDISAASDLHSIIAESDLAGNIIYVNDNFVKISQYSREELIGAPHSILRSGHHPDSFFQRMWKTIQSGQVWRGTIKNKAKDGSHYWVKTLIKPIFDSSGNIKKYIAIRTDVSGSLKLSAEKKRLEQKAKNSLRINYLYGLNRHNKTLPEVLKLALEILFAANWSKNKPSGGVLLTDSAGASLSLVSSYQLPSEQQDLYLNLPFSDSFCGQAASTNRIIVESEDLEENSTSLKYAIPISIGKQVFGILLVILRKTERLSVDEEANLEDFANALAVITSFKRREEELVAERERVQKALEIAQAATLKAEAGQSAKASFLATMSHELRTPLNGVVGMLHVLKQSELNQEQHEDVDVAMASADMLLTLISDILDFSKLDYGSIKMEREVINLRDLVHKTQLPLEQMAIEKGLAYSCRVADDVPEFCVGDSTRIRQIGVNLVSNAIKFTDKGGIDLSVEMCEPPTGRTGGRWTISKICDTGVGIPKDVHDVIFDRFSQADDTITRKFGGTGLGLAICKQLVELMGGEIGLDSELGKGSCFWYKLPCIEVDAQGNRIQSQ